MVNSQFSLTWDAYKSSICNGFSTLQQNGEFVDMTLAADGHYVKVHQILLALASPYLKEMLSSAPCQHPVLFLNDVSHKSLNLLLEYIYTGEVQVPADCFNSFAKTAKALHIMGLEHIGSRSKETFDLDLNVPYIGDSHVQGIKRLSVPSGDHTQEIHMPAAARNVQLQLQGREVKKTKSDKKEVPVTIKDAHDSDDDYVPMDDTADADSDDAFKVNTTNDDQTEEDNAKSKAMSSNLQFTVSQRGSMQIILNRYVYNLHSSKKSGLKRWRCVDYRNSKCSAFVVTKGNIVLNRANLHNHSFHDKKILSKIEKNSIFSAAEDAKAYDDSNKQKEAEEVGPVEYLYDDMNET